MWKGFWFNERLVASKLCMILCWNICNVTTCVMRKGIVETFVKLSFIYFDNFIYIRLILVLHCKTLTSRYILNYGLERKKIVKCQTGLRVNSSKSSKDRPVQN